MPVAKIYSYAEVKSAIDIANDHYYKQLLRVRSDVSNDDFGTAKVKNFQQTGSLGWTGKGSDVGHSNRHLKGAPELGKSTYATELDMVNCTLALLNSSAGQKSPQNLDTANPTGESDPDANRAIEQPVGGDWYGFPRGGTTKTKIKTAHCDIMKLGENTLWVHTTWPATFAT